MSATYNAKDQMVSMTPAGGAAINFAYSGSGQSERTSAGTTTFVNDQLGIDTSKTGTSTTHYIHDSKGGLIAKREPSGSMYYYLFDALSSVIGLSGSTGTLVNTYKYDPFGQLTASTGTVPNPFKFASYYADSTTGLFHVGQRYYDPSLARWSQQDPVNNPTSPHGWNRYVYAGDNPINFTDPSGRLTSCQLAGVGVMVINDLATIALPLIAGGLLGGPVGFAGVFTALFVSQPYYDWYELAVNGFGVALRTGAIC